MMMMCIVTLKMDGQLNCFTCQEPAMPTQTTAHSPARQRIHSRPEVNTHSVAIDTETGPEVLEQPTAPPLEPCQQAVRLLLL